MDKIIISRNDVMQDIQEHLRCAGQYELLEIYCLLFGPILQANNDDTFTLEIDDNTDEEIFDDTKEG
jgi:hypothetical protein